MRVTTKKFPTQALLTETFVYDDVHLGALVYRGGVREGTHAGCDHASRHRLVKVCTQQFALRDLIYIYHHGSMEGRTFNINGDKKDNRIDNIQYIPRAVSFM